MEKFAVIACNGRTFEQLQLAKMAMYQWAAMESNGNTLEELSLRPKMQNKSGLQWAATGKKWRIFRN